MSQEQLEALRQEFHDALPSILEGHDPHDEQYRRLHEDDDS